MGAKRKAPRLHSSMIGDLWEQLLLVTLPIPFLVPVAVAVGLSRMTGLRFLHRLCLSFVHSLLLALLDTLSSTVSSVSFAYLVQLIDAISS